jgi:hypothetical protein
MRIPRSVRQPHPVQPAQGLTNVTARPGSGAGLRLTESTRVVGTSGHPLPNPNRHPQTGTFAPDLSLHTDQGATRLAELMHTARPILLDHADRPDLRETAPSGRD